MPVIPGLCHQARKAMDVFFKEGVDDFSSFVQPRTSTFHITSGPPSSRITDDYLWIKFIEISRDELLNLLLHGV